MSKVKTCQEINIEKPLLTNLIESMENENVFILTWNLKLITIRQSVFFKDKTINKTQITICLKSYKKIFGYYFVNSQQDSRQQTNFQWKNTTVIRQQILAAAIA